MTKPKREVTPVKAKDAPSKTTPRVTPQGEEGGSIGNLRDSRRGRDLTPSRDHDPDAREGKA